MEGKTHIIGGIAAGALYMAYAGPVEHEALLIAGCAIGATIPDICHPGSMIGRKLPIFSFLISKTFGHRTFTHSLVFCLLTALLFAFTPWFPSVEIGLWLGIVSHLLLDAMTKDGIQFLWPFKVRIGVPIGITTGGMLEKVFAAFLIATIAYSGYHMYL